MNRTDVVKSIANKEGMTAAQVQAVLQSFVDVVALNLSLGEEVSLRDFGKFEPRDRKPVVRKNPRTGAEIPVPAKTTVGFVASPNFKARLNGER